MGEKWRETDLSLRPNRLPSPPDVPEGAPARDAAQVPPAPDQVGGGRPAAALLPPLDPALLQTRVPRHRGPAHVGGLLGSLPGETHPHTPLPGMPCAHTPLPGTTRPTAASLVCYMFWKLQRQLESKTEWRHRKDCGLYVLLIPAKTAACILNVFFNYFYHLYYCIYCFY